MWDKKKRLPVMAVFLSGNLLIMMYFQNFQQIPTVGMILIVAFVM